METIKMPTKGNPDVLRHNRWLLKTTKGLKIDERRIYGVHVYHNGTLNIEIPLLETDDIDAIISEFKEKRTVSTTFELYLLNSVGEVVSKKVFEDKYATYVYEDETQHFSYLDDSAITLKVSFTNKETLDMLMESEAKRKTN